MSLFLSSQTTHMLTSYLIIVPISLITSHFLSKSKLSIVNCQLLIKIFIILYGVYLFLMSLARYYNFRSEIIDLSYYDHVIYQLSQFKIPHVWDVPQWFVWGDHFDGILFLFVPLYWLKREPAFLMAIQSGLAILATIPIYLYAKEKFLSNFGNNFGAAEQFSARSGSPPIKSGRDASTAKLRSEPKCQNLKLLALSVSFAYLLFSPHQMGYLYGFHEIVMFPFFFFWMLFFLEKKKTKLFLLFLFLTTIIKEETSLYLIFLGIFFIYKNFGAANVFFRPQRVPPDAIGEGCEHCKKMFANKNFYAIVFIITGLAWYLFTFQIIFPHFYPHWDIHTGLYGNLSSLKGITELLQPYKLGTIINHLAPFGFLPLLYPPSLIVTIPAWLQKLLTNDIASLSGFHYSSALTALLIFASIESISHYLKLKFAAANVFLSLPANATHSVAGGRADASTAKLRSEPKIQKISIFIVFISFFSNFFLGYSPSSLRNISLKEFTPTPGQQTAYDFMGDIPQSASVSASYILVPHLKKPTGQIHAIPRNNEDSDYILIDHNISIPLTTASLYKQYLSALEKKYTIIKSQDNIFLLKRN